MAVEQLISAIPWDSIGPSGLLAITILSIINGWIVPRRTYEALERDRDYWREAAERREAQIDALTETARTAVAALDSLPRRRDSEV